MTYYLLSKLVNPMFGTTQQMLAHHLRMKQGDRTLPRKYDIESVKKTRQHHDLPACLLAGPPQKT